MHFGRVRDFYPRVLIYPWYVWFHTERWSVRVDVSRSHSDRAEPLYSERFGLNKSWRLGWIKIRWRVYPKEE